MYRRDAAAPRRLEAVAAAAATGASASDLAVHLDERYAFDGSHSDFAQQFLRLYLALGGDAGAVANASAVAAPVASQVPDEVVAYVQTSFSLAFASLPPLLQLAVIWDSGFVMAAALGYVRVRTRCGLRMSELALSPAGYASAGCVQQTCSAPDGELFYQSLYCNGAQMSAAALCAATDGVAPVHAPMWSSGGRDDTVPVAEMAKHQWADGDASYTVFAIHLAGDPNIYGKCSLPSITVPCALDDGSDRWCEPERGRLVQQWLAHEQIRQGAAPPPGEQQVQTLGDGESAAWTRETGVVVAVAVSAAVVALALAAVAILWWRSSPSSSSSSRGRSKRAILGDEASGDVSWGGRDGDRDGDNACWPPHEVDFALEEPTIRTSRSFNLLDATFRDGSAAFGRGGSIDDAAAHGKASSAMSFSPLSPPALASPPSSLRVVSAAFYPPEDPQRLHSGSASNQTVSATTTTSAASSAPASPSRPGRDKQGQEHAPAAEVVLTDHEQSPLSSSSVVISSNPALEASFHAPLSPDSALHKLPHDPHVLALRVAAGDIRRLQQLAVGAYGEVWLGRLRGELVAVKRLRAERRRRSRELEAFAAEILLMTRLAHPNVLALRGVAWTTLSSLSLVMEFMARGDLHRVLQREGARLPWAMAKARLARDVARALAYLHARGVVHRDLKSKNVLVGEELGAKLSDFGTSRYRSEKHSVRSLRIDFVDEESDGDAAMVASGASSDQAMTAGVGTAYWTAPEVLAGGRYAEKADVYSFGVVLSELDTCQLPFSTDKDGRASMRQLQVLSMVVDGELRPRFLPSCPDRVRKLATACLSASADARPTAVELVEVLDAFVSGLL